MATVCEKTESTPCFAAPARKKVAYVVSRFPKLTETFVLFEMLAVKDQGVDVEIYPLLRARNSAVHPEGASLLTKFLELWKKPDLSATIHAAAKPLVAQAHYQPLMNWAIFWAQWCMLLSSPLRYLKALGTIVWANLGSANYLLGGLAIFPKAVFFARHMQRLGITHVHAHFANHPAAAAYIIHAMTDIPFSFTGHGADLQVDQHMLREKVDAADHVITISNDNRRFILRYCGDKYRDRVHVVRCGVDTDVFVPPEMTCEAGDGRITVVCTGTLYEVKGHTYLIEACRILVDRGIDVRCHLIGDGPLREELVRQVESSGLRERVVFLGRLTREQIAEQLAHADVLVAPSVPTKCGRREGIPVVLMEAMATGLPVIASDISGIPELVSDGQDGLLVAPRDSQAIAAAIERLHDHPELRVQLGSAARQTICAEYNQQSSAARLCQYFH